MAENKQQYSNSKTKKHKLEEEVTMIQYDPSDCVISLDKFDDLTKKELECPICLEPAFEAMEWRCCRGITCNKCCQKIAKHEKCMVCRTLCNNNNNDNGNLNSINSNNNNSVNSTNLPYTQARLARTLLNSCQTKCLFSECKIELILDNLKHHLKNECKFLRLCECQIAYNLTNSNFEVHQSSCPQTNIECPNNCGVKKFLRMNLQEHLQSACPNEWTQCKSCYYSDARHRIVDHERETCKVKQLENQLAKLRAENQSMYVTGPKQTIDRELIQLNPGPFDSSNYTSHLMNSQTFNILPPDLFETFTPKQNEKNDFKILLWKVTDKFGYETRYSRPCKIEYSTKVKVIVVTLGNFHRWFLRSYKNPNGLDNSTNNNQNNSDAEIKVNEILVQHGPAYKSISIATNPKSQTNFIIPATRGYEIFDSQTEYPFFTQKNSMIYQSISFQFEGNGARPNAENLFRIFNSVIVF